MSRFWNFVFAVIAVVVVASAVANAVYPQSRLDPLPPRWIGRTLIGTLLGFGGVAVWAFWYQERLCQRQCSLTALLLLPPAAIVPIKVGFWLLSDYWPFWTD